MREHQEWVGTYRSERARLREEAIREMEKAIEMAKKELEQEDEKLWLLDGDGENLEALVKKFFEALGCTVERRKKGASLDYLVKEPHLGHQIALKILGLDGKFEKSTPVLSEVLSYLPDYCEKNAGGKIEHIVLVVNTLKNTPLEQREKEDFALPVVHLSEKNGICLIRSIDVFNLWNDLDTGADASTLFNRLFETSGLFQYIPPKAKRG